MKVPSIHDISSNPSFSKHVLNSQEPRSSMQTVLDGRDAETPREWLKLSLGGDLGSPVDGNSELSTRTSPRVYPCKFCTRAFYTAYSLGGHQNAHKTERSEARRRKTMGKLLETRPLGVQGHSFVQKPGCTVRASASTNEDCGRKEPSHAEELDLNLKL